MENLKYAIKLFFKYLFLLTIGGITYYMIEVMYKGHSHISMFYLGGICFVICGLLNEIFEWDTPIELQMLISSIIITGLEFITGLIVNVWLGLNIWDYSNIPFNIMGQVCLLFYGIWFFLSAAAIILDDYIRYYIFKEEKPRYYSWILKKIKK